MKKLLLLLLLLFVLQPPEVQSQTLVPTGTPHQFWYLDHILLSADDSLLYRSGIGSWPMVRATFFRVTTDEEGRVVSVKVDPRSVDLPVKAVREMLMLKPTETVDTVEQILHDAVWRACIDSLGVPLDSLGWAARTK